MRLSDRLRAVPPHWYVVAATSFGVLLIGILVVTGGDDRIDTVNATNSTVDAGLSIPGPSITTTDSAASSTTARNTTLNTTTTTSPSPFTAVDLTNGYSINVDEDHPAVIARPLPAEPDPNELPPSTLAPPTWAASTRTTSGGYLGTDVGCARDVSARALDEFFAARVGPVLGWDYQHVYPLGGDRYLWLFQDAFVDQSGAALTLNNARFVHNAAVLQTGPCFTLLHRGSASQPAPFELGDGDVNTRSRWFWPMGGETSNGQLWVFWAEMIKDPYDPAPPDGLGWHPERVFLASYDTQTLQRTAFVLAPDSNATPIYGYAVSSDATHTYLFGNTFEQNLVREGGFWSGQHTATAMWLARVPKGQLATLPEYRTADGWSPNRVDAVPIVKRFYVENPMQPRYLDGQWVSATDVDGYWGDSLAIDVAPQPWGPWTTVQYGPLLPRGGDPKMNTYHAHLLPWRDGYGSILIAVSNNARDMVRDAYPTPYRYRPQIFSVPYAATPPPPPTTLAPVSTTTSTTTKPTAPTTTPSTTTTTTPSTTASPTSTTTSTPTTTTTTNTTTSTTTTTTSTTTSTTTTTPTATTTSTTIGP